MAYPWTFFTKNFSSTPPSDPLGWRDLHMRVKGVCPFEHTKNHFPGIRINQIRYGVSFIDGSLCKNTQICNTINHYDAIKDLTWYYFVLVATTSYYLVLCGTILNYLTIFDTTSW